MVVIEMQQADLAHPSVRYRVVYGTHRRKQQPGLLIMNAGDAVATGCSKPVLSEGVLKTRSSREHQFNRTQ